MLPTSFEQRMLDADRAIKDNVFRRYDEYRHSDWSFLKGSQKLFCYSEDEAIDGIPIDWFVRGCLRLYEAPAAYRGNQWDVLTMNKITPLMEYLEELVKPDFTLRLFINCDAPKIVTIFLNFAKRTLSSRYACIPTTNIDGSLTLVADRSHLARKKRSRSRSPERKHDRSRSRSRHSKKEKSKRSKRSHSKRSRSRSRSPLRDTHVQDVFAELVKLIATKKETSDPKALADKLLASFTDL
jgi:hypothetical protein